MKTGILIVFFGMVTAFAQKPTQDEIKKVMDYYNNGDEAAVAEMKLCKEVIKEGPEKNNCAEEAVPAGIQKGEKVFLWVNLMVPKNQNPNISFQYSKNDRSIKTKEVAVTSALRYRTWQIIPTNKLGQISVTIDQEKGEDYVNIGKIEYTVSEVKN